MSKVSFSSKSRLFHLVFYPDSATYSATKIFEILSAGDTFVADWAYILHDSDLGDDGLALKPHYHLVVRFQYPVTYQSVLDKLSLPSSAMNLPSSDSKGNQSFRRMVRYLVHADNDKKFQYGLDCIVSNFDISSFFDSVTEDKQTSAFLDLLDAASAKSASKRSVAIYAAQSGTLSYYRMYYRIIWDIVHDEEIWYLSLRQKFEQFAPDIDFDKIFD